MRQLYGAASCAHIWDKLAQTLLYSSLHMIQLVHIALRRPYTFIVLAILIVLLGVQTTLHMPTDVFPNILIPVTSVVWAYDGLLPKDVEGRITYIFERFLTSTVEGIKYIQSHSYFGSSIITDS